MQISRMMVVGFLVIVSCSRDQKMVALKSGFDFATSVSRVDSLIKIQPSIQLIAKIDYRKNARKEDLLIRPTVLFIYGNPSIYSLMVTCKQTLAVDLPQKLLIWQDDTDQVWVGYAPPPSSKERNGVNCEKVLRRMSETSHEIASKAAGRFSDYAQ